MIISKFSKNFFFAVSVVAVFFGLVFVVQAASKKDIVYPVKELNGCKTEKECRAYCDDSNNMEACVAFAEKYSLMSKSEIQTAKKFIGAGKKGPGSCSSKESCESYCDDVSHLDECLVFAEKNDFMEKGDLEEAKKIQTALKKGAKLPGGCSSKDACDSYCNDPNHMEECITFAESAGFLPPDELEEAKKVMTAMKKGAKPPPCRGKKECDRYCSDPANLEACLVFAEAAGLIPEDELQEAKMALEAIKKGVKMPDCRGKKECDAYCGQPEHLEECLNFAVAAGFMSEEEMVMARKTGGKGPGGCRGKEECEAFCENPDNQETCYEFGLEHDLISEEDLEMMEDGKAQMQEALEDAPDEVVDCLVLKLGGGVVEQMREGTARPSQKMGETIRACFDELMPRGGEFDDGGGYESDFEEEDFSEDGDEPDESRSGMPSREDVLRMLPPNLPDSVLECVESQLDEETISSGRAGIQSLVEGCFVEANQGGNIFQSAQGFLLKVWNKIKAGKR
ncbi:hypothetical protein A3A21_03840 [Candidatus Jorgensenbacteria bacterium RIFCSPLOWO2_01_FULL_45_25b]|uniref:Uncharacterized protein n=1 Tax=Candidatus Jorgensenbacteria bacterium RIFCSPLOWO2_01_FULL_45_25b TaxID=1798471 RepID=A0A1F6BXN7_9BACT|nr:MAG: hypothetical protein A3A21_03840 [Candidatus Jorgensenbacteria bacterium RIFCSPLOWO2_01_FULL_45_25b]